MKTDRCLFAKGSNCPHPESFQGEKENDGNFPVINIGINKS